MPRRRASLGSYLTQRGIPRVKFRCWRGALPAILAVALMAAAFAAAAPQPELLWNQTDSEPEGLYVRVAAAPRVGRLIAFRTPGPAFPYADARMGYLHQVPILKKIAAGEGDLVCARGDILVINGRRRAPVAALDRTGRPLPHWDGCRALLRGEFFVFSDRISNSFDSRYYGPVRGGSILGVFEPLALSPSPRGAS